MQRRDVGLKVAGRKLRPAFLFMPQQLPQVFRLIGLGLIPQDETQVIRKGELIEVVKISGVKLIVKRVKEA